MPFKDGCIFCDIGSGKSPANIEYQDDKIVAFWDIQPKAPIHVLIVPKDHLTWRDVDDRHTEILGWMDVVAKRVAEKKNLAEDGYRLVMNSGRHAGQIVDHIHLHLLGGKQMGPMA